MTDPTGRVLAELADGRHDGRLIELLEAIGERAKSEETSMLWRITLGNETWDAETVTIGEIRFVEKTAARSWLAVNPSKYMDHMVALVTARYHKVHGMDLDAAIAKAEAISEAEAVAAVDWYEGSLGKSGASAVPTAS